MHRKSVDLYNEVEQVVLDLVSRVGLEKLPRAEIVRQFAGRGRSDAALFRWIARIVASGRPGQRLAAEVKAAVAQREVQDTAPMAAVAAEIADKLPQRVSLTEVRPRDSRSSGSFARS